MTFRVKIVHYHCKHLSNIHYVYHSSRVCVVFTKQSYIEVKILTSKRYSTSVSFLVNNTSTSYIFRGMCTLKGGMQVYSHPVRMHCCSGACMTRTQFERTGSRITGSSARVLLVSCTYNVVK